LEEFIARWKEAKSLILRNSFERRYAISIIQLIDEDYFLDESYVKTEIIEEDTKYLILTSPDWNENILADMINYMEFHLAMQWFAEKKAEENLRETIKVVNDLQFTIENETTLELLGCVNYGKEIIWLNPNLEYQSKVFQALSALLNVVVVFE
jgi:hypothetical protein